MPLSVKAKSFYKLLLIPVGFCFFTIFATLMLINSNGGASIRLSNNASAVTSNQSATASVTVGAIACTMSGTIATGNEHTATINPGGYAEDIGTTNLSVICNDPDGFDLYAVGYSGTSSDLTNTAGTIGNTNMVSDNTFTIATGLNTPTSVGDGSSNWAMKLSLVTPYDASTPNILSDTSGSYADYHVVPSAETKVASFNASTGSSISSKINTTYRVYLNTSQPAGTYKGQVKYTIAGHNPNTSFSLYMQDFTPEMCETLGQATEKYLTLYDKRDGNSYTVAYINGSCWMTQNLRITGTISSMYSNFTGPDINISQEDLDMTTSTNTVCTTSNSDACNSYTVPMTHDSNNTITGVWYNYVAATAGTITGVPNTTNASQDICPAGWKLPSGPSTTVGTDFNKLVGNTYSGWQNQTVGLTDFSGVAGGVYMDGALSNTVSGAWWANTVYSGWNRDTLAYDSNNGQFNGNNASGQYVGRFVRCVL